MVVGVGNKPLVAGGGVGSGCAVEDAAWSEGISSFGCRIGFIEVEDLLLRDGEG